MVSFLHPSQLRAKIAQGFKGQLLAGTLTRRTSNTVNEYGDSIPGVTQQFTVNGCVDEYDEIYRLRAGIPEGSSKIILIAGLCDTEPLKDDYIVFPNFPKFQVRKVKTDPAIAHYECESFKVNVI